MRAVFVPLSQLQQELEIDDRVNTMLVALDDDPDATAIDRVDGARARAGRRSKTLACACAAARPRLTGRDW